MKRLSGMLAVRLAFWLLITALLTATCAWAKPTTPAQARTAVLHWLGLDAVPLGARLGRQIKEVQTFKYEDIPAYYVVYLNPAGMVIVAADDLVEPIIAFLPSGKYDPSPANPLYALVSRDIPGRVMAAREVETAAASRGLPALETLAPGARQARARRKWDRLRQPAAALPTLESSVSGISDVRVAPFVESKWDQSTVNGQACYNYYTPPYTEGTPENYVCGCVATAMAQLMRYFRHPLSGIGVQSYDYYLSGFSYSGSTRGGDDAGAPYNWDQMELDPLNPVTPPLTLDQRQAIGRLTWDAGLAVHMNYDTVANGGSGAYMSNVRPALTGTFGYSNAKYGNSFPGSNNIPPDQRNAMINPNLHAKYPVLLGIYYYVSIINQYYNGHAIVCDGYGYASNTLYHHLNMGWSGSSDAWYNLPDIGTAYGFNSVTSTIYNVYKTGSGEIIAGRVTDDSTPGLPLSGVTVTATGGGGPYTTTTDANGIYALAKVPSNTSFTVSASKAGYTFTSKPVSTGTSIDNSTTTGNLWGIDFVGVGAPLISLNQALDNTRLSFSTSGNANWYGENTTSYYGGSAARSGAISHNQYSQLQTTVVGPGTFSFYWQVSSQANADFLELYLDAANLCRISGEVNWSKITVAIPAGIHTLTWKYSKDGSVSSGSDCGWVDKVEYNRTGTIGPILLFLLND